MNLGLNLGLGVGGGVLLPAATSEIVQWLKGLDPAGIVINDKVNPLIVNPEPEVRDAACGNFSPSGILPGEREIFIVDNSVDFSDTGFVLECVININQNTSTQSIVSQQPGTGTGYTLLGVLSNGFLWSQFGTPDSTFSLLAKPTIGADHLVKLEYDATTNELTCTIDGSSQIKTSVAGDVPSNGDIIWGAGATVASQWFEGLLADAKMSIPEAAVEPVFLFAGQSNMVAFSLLPPPSDIETSAQHKFTYSVNGTAGVDEVLQVVDTTRWSTELSIGNALSTPHTFIKTAVGGTGLWNDWQKGGTEYNLFVSTVQTAFDAMYARGKVPFVRGMIWMQGEQDATAHGTEYYNNFQRFWGDFTEDVKIPRETPVILSRLSDGAKDQAEKSDVQQAQDDLGLLPWITTINTDAATFKDDPPVHYDLDGLVSIGNDMIPVAQSLPSVSGDLSLFEFPISELTTDELFDVSGNQRDTAITIGGGGAGHTSTVFRSLRQDKYGYAHLKGFSNRLTLNGTSSLITTASGSDLTGGFTFRCSGRLDDLSVERDIWSIFGARKMLGISALGQFNTRMGDGGFEGIGATGAISAGDSFDLIFSHDGVTTATLTTTINGVIVTATNATVPTAEAGTPVNLLGVAQTAGANFFAGLLASATLDGVFSYTSFPSATTVSDQLGSNDGTITAGAVLAVPALEDKSLAADGLSITNPGGFVHNGSEVTLIQTGFGVGPITVSNTTVGTVDGVYSYTGERNGKGVWELVDSEIAWSSSQLRWILSDTASGEEWENLTDSTYPPLTTGWTISLSTTYPAPILAYTIDGTNIFGGATIWGGSTDGLTPYVKVAYTDLLAKLSGENNTWIRWTSVNGVCVVSEMAQYLTSKVLTSAEDSQNRRYFQQGDCGQGFFSFIVLVDGDSNALVDGEGNLLGSFP